MFIAIEIVDEELFNEYFPMCNGKVLLQPEWFMEGRSLLIPVYPELVAPIEKNKDVSLSELFELKDSDGEYLLPWDLPFFKQFGNVKII